MEQNVPVLAKRVWSLVRVVYFMLRKGISKGKFLLLDLNIIVKRGQIAGKTLQNLMFNRRSHKMNSHHQSPPSSECEFSCINSPVIYSNHSFSKKQHSSIKPAAEDLDMMAVSAALLKSLEMIHSETTSPALPGFGRSPVVRQIRVTDSPFPLRGANEDSGHVDEAAEQFISRFYNDLRRQNSKGESGSW